MNVGIIGASGYSGELLVKLLARHPRVQLAAVTSRKLAGTPVAEALPFMRGQLGGLVFTQSDPQELAAREDIDLFFLALPHGVATEYARPLFDAGKKVIDLSADYRLGSAERYEEFYGQPHPDPELLQKAAYVIPEITETDWKGCSLIASPGCYPTSIITPLVPLLRQGVVSGQNIVVCSFSGVSGAGKKAAEFYSYSERTESTVTYGLPKHRHLSEIEEQLSGAAGTPTVIQFVPHLAPMKQGIHSTITLPSGGKTLDELYAAWNDAFKDSPFVTVLPSGTYPDTKYVVGTNRVDFSAVHDSRTGNFVITSAIDNLMKGASGQAVQIMNLWLGFDETAGLI